MSSRAQRILELVLDLGRNEGEVQYGDNRVLFCFHSAVAFSNRDGNVYVTTDPVADNVKAMIKYWAAGRPMQPVDQATITRLTYTLARSMESSKDMPTSYGSSKVNLDKIEKLKATRDAIAKEHS